MTTPTVAEAFIALEPVTRDDFADSLPSGHALEPPPQRDQVILKIAAGRAASFA